MGRLQPNPWHFHRIHWIIRLGLADAGLLGIWGALGTSRTVVRLATVLLTTAYLCALTTVAEMEVTKTAFEWGVETALRALGRWR